MGHKETWTRRSRTSHKLPVFTDYLNHQRLYFKMLWRPLGCCCFSLRTGSLTLGTLSVIGAVFGILSIVNLYWNHEQNVEEMVKQICTEQLSTPEYAEDDIDHCITLSLRIVVGVVVTIFVINIIRLTISGLLIHGIRTNKTSLMVPYMVFQMIYIILAIKFAVILCIAFLVAGQIWSLILVGLLFGAYLFLETYFLLVKRALYLQMKADGGYHHVELKEEGRCSPVHEIKKEKY